MAVLESSYRGTDQRFFKPVQRLNSHLHVARVNTRAVDPECLSHGPYQEGSCSLPWIVQIVLPSLDQQDLQLVVKIGKPASRHAARAASTTHDNINFIGDRHFENRGRDASGLRELYSVSPQALRTRESNRATSCRKVSPPSFPRFSGEWIERKGQALCISNGLFVVEQLHSCGYVHESQ